MTADVLKLVRTDDRPNEGAIELVEGLIDRLKSGDALAVAFVEVRRGNTVCTGYSTSNQYHCLNSGAAILASRLAAD